MLQAFVHQDLTSFSYLPLTPPPSHPHSCQWHVPKCYVRWPHWLTTLSEEFAGRERCVPSSLVLLPSEQLHSEDQERVLQGPSISSAWISTRRKILRSSLPSFRCLLSRTDTVVIHLGPATRLFCLKELTLPQKSLHLRVFNFRESAWEKN